MEFGEKIYLLREKGGYKAKAIASYLKVDVKEVEAWEAGDKVPGLETMIKLAEFYNVNVDVLTDETKDVIPVKAEKQDRKIRSKYWTYPSLIRRKKIIPITLFSIFGLPFLIVGLILYIPNFYKSSAQLLATIALVIAILGFLMLASIPFLIKAKVAEYEYKGHPIIAYSSIYATYLIVDGYVRDYTASPEKTKPEEGKRKHLDLQAKVEGVTVVLKRAENETLLLQNEEGHPIQPLRRTGKWKGNQSLNP